MSSNAGALRSSPSFSLPQYFICFKGIVWREGLRFLHQRERFISALVRPLVWLFIFAAGLRQVLEKPDDTKLIEDAINGMLHGLDPHSSYVTPKEFQDMRPQARAANGGLGVEVLIEDGIPKVIAPIDNAPADKAGVLAGVFITHLDGDRCKGCRSTKRSRRCGDLWEVRCCLPSCERAFPTRLN